MFNLLPKDTVFFELFENIARLMVAAAGHLRRLAKEFPQIDGAIHSIRKAEHDADDLAHTALDRLDRTFITPFDREDIHTLVQGMDDIIDQIDALCKRIPDATTRFAAYGGIRFDRAWRIWLSHHSSSR